MGALLGSLMGFVRDFIDTLNETFVSWFFISFFALFVAFGIFGLRSIKREGKKINFGDLWPTLLFLVLFCFYIWEFVEPKVKGYIAPLWGECGNLCDKYWWRDATETKLKFILALSPKSYTIRGENGGRALHWAAQSGTPHLIRILVDEGAYVNAGNDWGETPLHWVSHFGPPENMLALIDAGADVMARTSYGSTKYDFHSTPLHWAAYLGTSDKVLILLNAGADASIINNRGESAWTFAQENENLIGTEGYDALSKASLPQ